MRYQYFDWDASRWQGMLGREQLRRLFQYLVTLTAGDVDEALGIMEEMRARGLLPPGTDLDDFRQDLADSEDISLDLDGTAHLTSRGERGVRRAALETVFGRLRKKGVGDHPVGRDGTGGEPNSQNRPYRFGDELQHIDFRQSYQNALRRSLGADLRLTEDDLEVREEEHLASCATVLLLDISHSMILYGEDRITPAKQVALALVELITSKFPKDSIDVVLFGNDAIRVPIQQLPYVQVGPYHTNTRAALQAARTILRRKKHQNKQVILITDGKPTVLTDQEGVVYRNTFGLDPRIVNKTLDQAVAMRRENIPITTFMIASDPYLQQFVHRLTELNRGKAYFSEPGKLGEYVLVDFVRNRRRRFH